MRKPRFLAKTTAELKALLLANFFTEEAVNLYCRRSRPGTSDEVTFKFLGGGWVCKTVTCHPVETEGWWSENLRVNRVVGLY